MSEGASRRRGEGRRARARLALARAPPCRLCRRLPPWSPPQPADWQGPPEASPAGSKSVAQVLADILEVFSAEVGAEAGSHPRPARRTNSRRASSAR
eukprot:scaffold8864_cov122-Isochrysis_galbana.AAC.9